MMDRPVAPGFALAAEAINGDVLDAQASSLPIGSASWQANSWSLAISVLLEAALLEHCTLHKLAICLICNNQGSCPKFSKYDFIW